MSYSCMDDEIEGEIIVLGRDDGGNYFKWFGESVNPMKIKNKQIILPTIEEYMESLDILVRDNHINEGEYKLKTDTLQKIWKAENEEEEEDEEYSSDEDEEYSEEYSSDEDTITTTTHHAHALAHSLAHAHALARIFR